MQQLSLLAPPEVPKVPGLVYRPEYITREEELELLSAIDREPWDTEWQRRRQVYGLSYGSAAAPRPFPPWLERVAERIVRDGWLVPPVANAVINEYTPGQGIAAHRDYPAFGPTVVAISLESACLLELEKGSRKEVLDVQPRSLWVLGGEARRDWLHGIAARRNDVIDGAKRARGRRVSITLRTAAADGGPNARR